MLADVVASAAVMLWLVVVAKAPGTLRAGSIAARWLLATFAFLAVGFTVFVPAVQSGLAGAVPAANLNQPLARTAILAAVFCAQNVLGLTGKPGHWRPFTPAAALAVCLGVMWGTYLLRDSAAPFGSHPVPDGWMTLFMLAFLLYLGYVLRSILVGCWEYGRASSGGVSYGLRLIAIGCAGGLAYVAIKLIAITLFFAGHPMDQAVESVAAQGVVALAVVPLAVGAVLTSAHDRWMRVRAWQREHATHFQLYPLWADLVSAVPGIALEAPVGRWLDAMRVRDMHLRLYRRLIELRDAWLELSAYADNPGVEHGPRSEALMLLSGMGGRAQREIRAGGRESGRGHPTSWSDELEWWIEVSKEWRSLRKDDLDERRPVRA